MTPDGQPDQPNQVPQGPPQNPEQIPQPQPVAGPPQVEPTVNPSQATTGTPAPASQPSVAPGGTGQPTPFSPQTPPVVPQSPVGPQPTPPPQSQPGGSNKKLIIIGSIVGAVVLIVAIVVVVIVSMMSVSEEDYRDAYTQYSKVSIANFELGTSISLTSLTSDGDNDTTFNNNVDKTKDILKEISDESAKLGELKAMQVGEGKEKYSAFNEKLEGYTKYTGNLLTSLTDMRSASKKCDSSPSSTADFKKLKASIDACVAELGKISETPDADVKALISELRSSYTKLTSIIGKLATIKNPYGSEYDQFKALRDQMYDVSNELRDAQSTYSSNMKKHAEEADPGDEADALREFLLEKTT